MYLDPAAVRDLAARLGHTGLTVVPQGRRYALVCDCGYRSTGRLTVAQAADTGRHHLEKTLRVFLASGRPFPTRPDAEEVFETPTHSVAS